MIGGNFRLDSIQAAVLNVKMKYLDKWNQKRRQNAAIYDKLFAGSDVKTPKIEKGNVCTYHQYTISVTRRNELHKYLSEKKIGSAIFYPRPLHLQNCFSELGYRQGDLPVTEKVCEEVLSLPIYPELSSEQIEYVARNILEFYKFS